MPPAIIAGAIAIGASYAASVGIISITAAMVIAVGATLAGALLTKTSVPAIGAYASQQERKQVLRSSAAAMSRVYGKIVTSGLLFFAEEEAGDQDDGEWVHLAIVVAGHEVDHIGQIWLGDNLIQEYGENATYEVHNNRADSDPYMLGKCPSWKTDMIGRGVCWVRLSLKFDQDKFPAGIPNFKCEVYGQKCYDPRNGSTVWTDNAALCILDFYRNVLKVPDSELIMSEFIQGANLCAESINLPNINEPRYRLNGIVDMDEAMAAILDDMHETCAGEPTYIGGQHGILVGAYYGPATMHIDESQIIDNIKIVPETSWRDKINMITGTFIDPEQNYVEADFPAVRVEAWIAEDGNEFSQDQKYRFVTSVYQAQRLAQIKLNRQRLGRTLELPLNFYGYRYRPGYYVTLSLPSLGIINQEFRVTKWELQPQGGVNITVRQETAAVWGDAVGLPIDRPDLTNLPGPGVSAPSNVQWVPVAENAEVNYQGELSWVNPSTVDYTQVTIYGNGKTVVSQQSLVPKIQVNGLDRGVQYTAYLRNSAKGGLLSSITTLQFTLTIDSKYYGDIYANNGYFKGTVYANNMVGDIYNKMSGGIAGVNPGNGSGFSWASTAGDHIMWSIAGDEFDRILDSNMTLEMNSGERQFFKIYMRTPSRPDVLLASFDTGNNGENGPLYFSIEGIDVPLCSRSEYNQLVVNVQENRSSTAFLITPIRTRSVMSATSGSPPPWGIREYDNEKSWVALYKKGRTPVISSDT
jgi:hypothetical protein